MQRIYQVVQELVDWQCCMILCRFHVTPCLSVSMFECKPSLVFLMKTIYVMLIMSMWISFFSFVNPLGKTESIFIVELFCYG